MQNIRLLIAHDNSHILQFLSNSLSTEFCSVATVSDGKALIAAAVALYPHIIIGMPTRAGLDAVRQLETLIPGVKIMVLTDHEEPEVAAAALAAAASTVVIKKRASDLCDKIRAIIRDLLTTPPKWPAAVSRSARPASQGVLQYS